MQLFETDTTGVLKPLPFTFKSEKGSSYSDRQICVVSRILSIMLIMYQEEKPLFVLFIKGTVCIQSRYIILHLVKNILTYSGRTPLQVSRENGKSDGYIFVEQYDWGGNRVARYKLDHWGRVISDGKRLYQVCYMYDDPLFFVYITRKRIKEVCKIKG